MRGRSKSCLHRRQPAEKSPRQSRVVGKNNPLSFGDHAGYISNQAGFDNELADVKKGPCPAPLRSQR